MSIDRKIQQELETEATELESILGGDQGMFEMAFGIFKSRLRGWIIVVNIFIIALTVAFIWCGYQFFMAETVDQRVFWGVWFILGLFAQAMSKLWLFMQMDRFSILREIKRQEIAINRLEQSLSLK